MLRAYDVLYEKLVNSGQAAILNIMANEASIVVGDCYKKEEHR